MPIEHPATYKIFVNGKLINTTDVYEYAMNRGLGIALYLGCEFENTKSPLIIDKWKSKEHTIIITKEKS